MKRVLVVDDDPVVAQFLKHALSDHKVSTWMNHFDKIPDEVNWAQVDVVIVDYILGVYDGTTILRWVAQKHPEITRIMLTGDMTVNTDTSPANLVMFKPPNIDELRDVVDGTGR